jgi:hypothetical protein
MLDDKQKQRLKLYTELPESIKDFLASDEMELIIDDALNLAKVSPELLLDTMDLITETLFLLLPKDQFKQELEKRLKISWAAAKIIDQVIQIKVFDRFKEELKQYRPQVEKAQKDSQKPLSTEGMPQEPRKETSQEKPINQFGELKKINIPKDYSFPQKKEPFSRTNTPVSTKKYSLTEKITEEEKEKTEIKKEEEQEHQLKIKKEEPIEEKQETKKEELQKEPEIKPIEAIIEQGSQKQDFPESNIPEYSFPEPSEVKVEKPIRKTEEFKKVIAPKTTSSQQEKIRQKLLEAMEKKDLQPKIINEMKNVLISKQNGKKTKEQEKSPRKKPIQEEGASTILSGKASKFKDEEILEKSSKEKPYILDVKLKEMKKEKKQQEDPVEPMQYKKYKKDSPFGKA